MDATILHNPACSTSRNTLALLREAGVTPTVIEYLKSPPTKKRLKQLIRDAGIEVRDAIRSKEAIYAELGLDDASLTDSALLDAMIAHPRLIERPFVETTKGVRLCRPIERVHEIL